MTAAWAFVAGLAVGWLLGVLTIALLRGNDQPPAASPQQGVPADEVCRYLMGGGKL